VNISSAIVYAQHGREAAVRARLSSLPGIEVHAASEDGKIIITMECDNDRGAMDLYEAIGREDGVLTISMVYQQTESHPDQEI
jgi:nitrate reductase NapD